MTKKAVALLSGGLDSLLAVRIMQNQGFEVEGFNVITPFTDSSDRACEAAEELGIPCHCERTTPDYLEIVRHPKYGYGKAVNPCLDCHLYMLRMAKKRVEETGADILITGEVLGQRPMSQQRHHLEMLEYHSGLAGRLIRPLSAKLLPMTEAERTGLVDREKLYSFKGRIRSNLRQLAMTLGISNVARPGAGCVLTERSFAPRVRDLLKYENERTEPWEFEILRFGRTVRLDEKTRCVMGRKQTDCEKLNETFMQFGKKRSDVVYWEPENYTGPSILLIGEITPDTERFAKSLQVQYSKNAPSENVVLCRFQGETQTLETFERE